MPLLMLSKLPGTRSRKGTVLHAAHAPHTDTWNLKVQVAVKEGVFGAMAACRVHAGGQLESS